MMNRMIEKDFLFLEHNNSIFNLEGEIIAVVTEGTSRNEKKILEFSGEMFNEISSFVEEVNSNGVFKPRTMVKKFEELLKKIDVK